MMDRLNNPSKIEAYRLADELKDIMRPLFQKHMDDIISGEFSKNMMIDWDNDDVNLLTWSMLKLISKTVATTAIISEQEYFDNGY
jgi:ketol-acid reductoisomerase